MIVVEPLDGFGGEVVEVLVGAFGVEPLHPVGGGDFDVVDVAPGTLPADEFIFERSDGGFGQRVVQGVADGADGGIDTFVDEPVGECHRRVLSTGIAVGDQAPQSGVAFGGAGEERVLDGIEDQVGGHRCGGAPAHDPATERVDDKGNVDEP